MSGTFPTDPSPASAELISKQPTDVSRAESGKRQARITGGHLWSAKLTWSKMTRYMLAPIFGFINKQNGRYGSFQIVLPNYATPNGVATGSPQTLGAGTAGSSAVLTDGWTVSTAGIMKSGDILTFSSHSKVYMMTVDVNSGGGGSALLNIAPPLTQDLADNEVVTVNDVEFTMSFDDDVIPWKGSAPNLVVLSADMTESL